MEDDPDFDFDVLVESIVKLARELFRSLAPSIGRWPRSNAYYGIDVIISKEEEGGIGGYKSSLLEVNYGGDFDSAKETQRQEVAEREKDKDKAEAEAEAAASVAASAATTTPITPKLLEINYAGDVEELKKVAEANSVIDEFLQWGDDLANALFTNGDLSKNERLIKL